MTLQTTISHTVERSPEQQRRNLERLAREKEAEATRIANMVAEMEPNAYYTYDVSGEKVCVEKYHVMKVTAKQIRVARFATGTGAFTLPRAELEGQGHTETKSRLRYKFAAGWYLRSILEAKAEEWATSAARAREKADAVAPGSPT